MQLTFTWFGPQGNIKMTQLKKGKKNAATLAKNSVEK